ncbi:hypothetical protein HID58_029902 [Brassica napus]|uniref:DUF4220 domain-containing protein n=1 Tax=Brassica napus TaxID=3708 RepID=A0ABQ8CGM0_BRANA|nr:hypothetical protein HID58_029902 [Brassica napus]
MDDKDSGEADVYAAAETERGEKVEPEKELCHGDDDGLSQLRGEESLADMEGLPVRETLAKDHVDGPGTLTLLIDVLKAWKSVLASVISYALGLFMIAKAPWVNWHFNLRKFRPSEVNRVKISLAFLVDAMVGLSLLDEHVHDGSSYGSSTMQKSVTPCLQR